RTASDSPTASERATDAHVRANVLMLGTHNPIAANETNAARTPSAARRPPKRRTTSTPSTVVPTQVSLKKKLVSHPTMLSRKLANPLKAWKKTLGCGTLRWSLSHV